MVVIRVITIEVVVLSIISKRRDFLAQRSWLLIRLLSGLSLLVFYLLLLFNVSGEKVEPYMELTSW